MPDNQHTLPFFPQAPLFDEVLQELKEMKREDPGYPVHICGKAAMVGIWPGELLNLATLEKYAKDHKPTEESKKLMKEVAIKAAAAAIRFAESL